ncbi:MAG: MgtC/SapB family protein [Bacteroidales bacterium]|nr:MgtC/SapB family protein [Bacteroidales bacterium]
MELTIRILAAGLMGAAIGYERELRGKSAGMRTHLLVALGSALLMIISQLGFEAADRFDAARIAAAVVGGLGFLGGGIIMKNKHVSGLTTAAGLWVTGAIGLAIGSGLYEIAILSFVIIIICMEAMYFYDFRLGDRAISITLTGKDRDKLVEALTEIGQQPTVNSIVKMPDGFKVDASLLIKKREFPGEVLRRIDAIQGITLESIE